MQTPAVKRVNLIIKKGTNGSLAITCLSAANVSTRVVRPDWYLLTYLAGVIVRVCENGFIRNDRES